MRPHKYSTQEWPCVASFIFKTHFLSQGIDPGVGFFQSFYKLSFIQDVSQILSLKATVDTRAECTITEARLGGYKGAWYNNYNGRVKCNKLGRSANLPCRRDKQIKCDPINA